MTKLFQTLRKLPKVEIELNESHEDHDPSRFFLFYPPQWAQNQDFWRLSLGYFVKFILGGGGVFTQTTHPEYKQQRPALYRQVKNHWHLSMHGMFTGYQAYGDDLLPITDWIEQFLLALLRWPGVQPPPKFGWVANKPSRGSKGN